MTSQQPDNHNNLLIAVALSALVIIGWEYLYIEPKLDEQREKARLEQLDKDAVKNKTGPQTRTPGRVAAPSGPGEAQTAPGKVTTPGLTRDGALATSARIAIDTPSLEGSLALQGALIDDLKLKKYTVTTRPDSADVTLYSPPGAPNAYFAEHGWKPPATGTKVPTSDTIWTAKNPSAKLTPETPVTLTWDNGAGLVFERTISVDRDYMFSIESTVRNTSSSPVVLTPYARIYRFGTPKIEGFFILHEGLVGVAGDEGLQEITFADALENLGATFKDKTGGWFGITEKYWASALIPDQKMAYNATLRARKPDIGQPELFWVDYALAEVTVPTGGDANVKSHLYAGAKKANIIDGYQEKYGIEKFDLMIDWGWFYFMTKPLNQLITWLYKIFGNFGVAILAVTVLVKLVFFPLANKSYVSMAKMKKLQPEMEKLRERFKDDKARQQQELMTLYKKEKINPLAGCLPILVQIPVFFALYKVLFVSIDMRHAPFFGWIQDLSAPDPTSIFNLFGLLPFDVPSFLVIGVWPLLMGLTMWIQMQLNPPQPDPVQQQIFSWMPVLFTVLLASFPAGLVIYWAWNNVLSVIQQWYITRKQGAEIHLMSNLKSKYETLKRLISRNPKTSDN